MAGAISKAVAKQKRKRALAKAAPALKTAGKAAAVVGLVAGAAYAARAVAKKRAEAKKLASRKKLGLAAAATAAGVTAVAAGVARSRKK